MNQSCEIREFTAFGPGYHKNDLYSPADIDRMVRNFARLKGHIRPVVKLGHDQSQRLAQSLGFLNIGEIRDVGKGPDGNLLIKRITGVPRSVAEQVNAGRLNSASIEILPSVPDPADASKTIEGPVLMGLALLGEEHPAVKGMDRPFAVFADGTPVPAATDAAKWLEKMGAVASFAASPAGLVRHRLGGQEYIAKTIAFSEMRFSQPPLVRQVPSPSRRVSMPLPQFDPEQFAPIQTKLHALGLTEEQIAQVIPIITGQQMSDGATAPGESDEQKRLMAEIAGDEEALNAKKTKLSQMSAKKFSHGPLNGSRLSGNGLALAEGFRYTYPRVYA